MHSFPSFELFSMSSLTIVSSPAYRFFRRQVRWSGIPISWRIFCDVLWSRQSRLWHSQWSRSRCFSVHTVGLANPHTMGRGHEASDIGPAACNLAFNFFLLLSILTKSSSCTSNTGNSIYWMRVRPTCDYTTPGGRRPVWCLWSLSAKERLQNVPVGKRCWWGFRSG